MNRYKYLLKNIGLLTLSSFATKLLSFFLVPLYTNILTTTEYGTYDLFNTTVSILIPILTLNVQDALMRFSIEKKYDRDALVTVSSRYFLRSCTIVFFGLIFNFIFGISSIGKKYAVFFFLMFFTHTLSGLIVYYVRGIDKIAELSISSIISSAITITLNIVFLVFLKWGLKGYFLANTIGPLIQCIYLMIRSSVFNNVHFEKKYNHEKNEMLAYSRPLIANSIAWWVNNASDRYVVIFFRGLAENGIYSVAGKIPSILNIIQTIFSQAWTLSAVKDFDPEDKNCFFANTYKSYNCLITVACSFLIVMDKVLAMFLYAKDFYVAWRYVPWLTIAILFGALAGYLGGVFAAVKDSKIFASSSVFGAVTNISLNIIFIPIIGALGAAIATMVCYIEVWGVRFWQLKKYMKLRVNIYRDIVSYIFLIIQATLLLIISNNVWLYIVEFVLFLAIFVLYFKDFMVVLKKIIKK